MVLIAEDQVELQTIDWFKETRYQYLCGYGIAVVDGETPERTDYWLVAHALARGYVVVTHEVPTTSIQKIKIPNACIGLNLRCMTPYEMLRWERARFMLAPTVESA